MRVDNLNDMQELAFALQCGLDEVRNQIVTCPDPSEYAGALAELEVRATRLNKLLQRATAELARLA